MSAIRTYKEFPDLEQGVVRQGVQVDTELASYMTRTKS
jgi:hypothetical protein